MTSPTGHSLFRLKFRFQFMLLWLPMIVGLGTMVVGGFLAGLALAPSFGVDPSASLSKQAHGGQYFMAVMATLLVMLVAGVAATYIGIWVGLRLSYRDAGVVNDILKGRAYPVPWYASPG